MLVPLKLASERVQRAKQDSDTTLFFELLYLGEFVLKLITCGMVAAIEDDRDGHRYRLVHTLLRADGVGEWGRCLNDVLSGPSSQFLVSEAKEDRRSFTERLPNSSWQYQAFQELVEAARFFEINKNINKEKISLQSWFELFPELRNKTRGHGAPRSGSCSGAAPYLEKSIYLVVENAPTLLRGWSYLRQNLSGKYHVASISSSAGEFSSLARSRPKEGDLVFKEGAYIYYDRPRFVDLLSTDVDLSDFFVPNGAFSKDQYELHSPITDSKKLGDAKDFLAPAGDKPKSETSGEGGLWPLGKVFANLPPSSTNYVPRSELEANVFSLLCDDRHPIVTLVGRGGIGKTSLALTVLNRLAQEDRFGAILWFSARDIDLTQAGPKVAKPDVLTEKDIANQFCEMLDPKERKESGFNSIGYMAENLSKSSLEDPLLFVFDNFETMTDPVDLFNWIDANIRLPNKALITTRFRDFKADYPVSVSGMSREQIDLLIDNTSARLGSKELFTGNVRDEIFDQSDGHPYIANILVGEITDRGYAGKPERIIAGKDDILQALFERTYNNLSAGSKRIFLTLCGWRSFIPQIAFEVLVFKNKTEGFDVEASVDELDRMSLIQRRSGDDGEDFLIVPLAASIFGHKKLSASPLRTSIEIDIRFLQELGPTNAASIGQGVGPRIRKLVQGIAAKISDGKMNFEEAKPLLEFIASRHVETWLLLADLVEELQQDSDLQALKREYLRRYIEVEPDGRRADEAWSRLALLYRDAGEVLPACDAYTRAFNLKKPEYYIISGVANWLNNQRHILDNFDPQERTAVFMPLARLMESRIAEATATDLSRLAWLYLHAGDEKRSEQLAEKGLAMEPDNEHCKKLIERLYRRNG